VGSGEGEVSAVRLVGKMRERGGEGDLKAGLDRPKTEYV
jgi:hypothetical protein